MSFLTSADWALYTNTINQASDTFNKELITWHSLTKRINRMGEDNPTSQTFTNITLEVLVQYNVFRTWPINKETKTGDLDKESILVIVNKQYLSDLGYLNNAGYFEFRPDEDRFSLHGKTYRCAGDTPASQTNTDPLLFYIIMEREILSTGSPTN
jgi:hypothetical protein